MGRLREAFRLSRSDGAKALIDEDQWSGSTIVWGRDLQASTLYLYDGVTRAYSDIYEQNPAVRQVVDFIADNIAQVPMKAYDRIADNDREHLAGHPIELLLKAPNPESTYYEFIRDLVSDLCIYDVTYWRKVRAGGKIALVRLAPERISFEGGDSLAPDYFIDTASDGTETRHRRQDVLWLHGYGSRRGISPLETLRTLLAEDQAAAAHRTGMFKNGLRNAGVIERPLDAPPWSDTARRNFIDAVTSRYSSSANAGLPLVLEEGMSWKNDQIDLSVSDYLQDRLDGAKTVARLYGISPQVINLEGAPYASISAYNAMLYQNSLAPLLTFITQNFERWLLSEYEPEGSTVYLEFALEAKLRGSFEEQAAALNLAVGAPWMLPNEARALRGLGPIEGGDVLATGGGGIQPSDSGSGATETPAEIPVDTEDPAEPKVAQKAAESQRGLVRRRARHASDLEAIINKTFDRMLARKEKAGPSFKAASFRSELKTDIRPVFERIVVAEGTRKANQRKGDFDPARVQHYLDKGADLFAANVIDAAKDDLDRPKEEVDLAKAALVALAARVALGQATHLQSFAREEAGRQTGAAVKTWGVVSSRSRHPELDGETAALGQPFSNGMGYPGDPAGGADQAAGCQCVLDIS